MTTSSMYIIYALQDPITFEIRYIGKSCSGHSRIKRHFRESENKYDKNKHKINWIKKLKNTNKLPNIIIIQEFTNKEDLAKAEPYWINYFFEQKCPLLNISLGGEQIRLSNETKSKLSISIKKILNTPEIKEKQINAIRNYYKSNDRIAQSNRSKDMWKNTSYRENIIKKRKETWENLEFREKIKSSIAKAKEKFIFDQYDNRFYTQRDAAKFLGVSPSVVCIAIKEKTSIQGHFLRIYNGN